MRVGSIAIVVMLKTSSRTRGRDRIGIFTTKRLARHSRNEEKRDGIHRRGTEYAEIFSKNSPRRPRRLCGKNLGCAFRCVLSSSAG
jgi:hypothetical protein